MFKAVYYVRDDIPETSSVSFYETLLLWLSQAEKICFVVLAAAFVIVLLSGAVVSVWHHAKQVYSKSITHHPVKIIKRKRHH